MEDVLNVYAKPLNPKEPVVCLDERPVQLLDDARSPIPADNPGKIFKHDSEYVRKGTAFAKMIARIVRAYPGTTTIHLVMDNLNAHGTKSLTDIFGEKRGAALWGRLTPHYAPKHASWLDQAEIEIGIFSRQCLGKDRVGNIQSLRKRAAAWNRRVNRQRLKINWKFTVEKARRKFKYDSPELIRSE